jgi:hypothetical protein
MRCAIQCNTARSRKNRGLCKETVFPTLVGRICDWWTAAWCADKCGVAYVAGMKLGIIYGAGGMILLVLVVASVVIIINSFQQPGRSYAYAI